MMFRSHGVLVLMVLFGCCSAGFRNFGRTTTEDGLNAAIELNKDIQGSGNGRQIGQNRNEQQIDPYRYNQHISPNGNSQSMNPNVNNQRIFPKRKNQQRYPNGNRPPSPTYYNGNYPQAWDNQEIDPYDIDQDIDPYGNGQQIDNGNNHQIDQQDNRQDTYGVKQQIDPYRYNQHINPNGNSQSMNPNVNNQRIFPKRKNQQRYPNGNRPPSPTYYNGNYPQAWDNQEIDPYDIDQDIDPYGNGQQIDNGNNHQIDQQDNRQDTYGVKQQIDPYRYNQHINPNGNSQSMNPNVNNQRIFPKRKNQQRYPNGNHPPSPTYQAGSDVCYTEKQERGRCVKTTLCRLQPPKYDPATGFIYKIGSMFGDNNDQSQRDEQCSFLLMCCPLDKINPTPVKPSVRPTPGCGYSNPGGSVFGAVFREKGGSATTNNGYADFAEFPWMVALLKSLATSFFGGGYIGGGTLIHPSVVMTAAHKVDTLSPSEVKCRAGEWNTFNEDEALLHQERNVRSIVVHEQFDRLYSRFDIALLFTSSPFSIEAHVNVACLSRALPPPGTGCYSMGWGEDLTKGTNYAVLLKKISLTLVRREACEPHGKRELGETYSLHRTLTCAMGTEMLDTCMGDGGSPLVCPIGDPSEQRYGVVGMVAYGFAQCGEAGVPGVYVSVPPLYAWVDSQMEMEGISDRTYVVT